jgi:hypothetical protein
MSVAGVHRRAVRRTFGVGANLGYRGFYHRHYGAFAYRRHPVARAAVASAAWGGGWGAPGWGGGWGGWGWNRPIYGATVGWGGGWGGWGWRRPLYARAAWGGGWGWRRW